MNQFIEFFRFELFQKLRQPLLYVYMLCLGIIVFYILYFSDKISFGVYLGNVLLDGPYAITTAIALISSLPMYLIPTLAASTATRDFDNRFYEIMYSRPLQKFSYYFGKFLAVWVTSLLIFILTIPAYLIALQFFVQPFQSGHLAWGAFSQGILLFLLPNSFIICAFTFATAMLFRNVVAAYVAVIFVSTFYSIANTFYGSDLDSRAYASYFDPYGSAALSLQTIYWTVSDKNTLYVGFKGLILYNRLIWMLISLLLLCSSYYFFSFSGALAGIFGSFKRHKKTEKILLQPARPFVHKVYNLNFEILALAKQTWLEFKGIITHISFGIIAGLGLFNLIFALIYIGRNLYGFRTIPVSYMMSDLIKSVNKVYGFIIIIFYAGQLVWSERESRQSDITNSLPIKNGVFAFGKIISLCLVVYTITLIFILCCIIYQFTQGVTSLDLTPYWQINLLLEGSSMCIWSAMAVMIHVLCNNKSLGYVISIAVIFVSGFFFDQLHMNHLLFKPWSEPFYIYSDMNRLSPYILEFIWYKTYGILVALVFVIVALLFWVRSMDERFKFRIQLAKQAIVKSSVLIPLMLILLCIGCTAGKIYYDTVIINKHQTDPETWKIEKTDIEKKYKRFEKRPQPRITNCVYEMELYPSKSRMDVKGTYTLCNKSGKIIDSLHVFCPEKIKMKIQVSGAKMLSQDSRHRYQLFRFDQPLQPGDSVKLFFESHYEKKGIENWVSNTKLTANGTFINKADIAPGIGYHGTVELYDKLDRIKYGLPPKDKLVNDTDSSARMENYLSLDADYGYIKATIGTEIDQIAIAPGQLLHKEVKNGRAYFTYQTEEPVLNFYSFLSGRYKVLQETYKGVSYEVYYHPGHDKNIHRMLKAMKDAVNYASTNFSPYKYHQARIIEFPRYHQFAQAFVGTMPYSESAGFIQDFDKELDIDIVYYVVVHEMAHQWWAHQVTPANVKGCTFMTESMAQYTALMIMEKEYGKEKIKKFLKYENDMYLSLRGTERDNEMPLIINQHQHYIAYQKASLVMYALRSYVGEEAINKALSKFIKEHYHQASPYPLPADLYANIKQAVPDSLQYLCKDMFETITLFDNRTTDAVYEKKGNTFKAYFTVESKKFLADTLGKETELPLKDWLDVAVFGKDDKVLVRQRIKLSQHKTDFEWTLKEQPVKAAIDPDYLLIDRISGDNYKNFKLSEEL